MHECAQTNAWVYVNICMSTRKQIHECMRISKDACEYIIYNRCMIFFQKCMSTFEYMHECAQTNTWMHANNNAWWVHVNMRTNKCMSACEYMHECAQLNTWVHANMYGCMWIYIYIINTWMHANNNARVHVNIYNKCMSACKYMHEYAQTNTWVHANKYGCMWIYIINAWVFAKNTWVRLNIFMSAR